MTRAHTAAIVSLIEHAGDLTVFVGFATDDQQYPYVIVRPGDATDRQERLAGSGVLFTPSYTVLCCGDAPDQAEWITERVDAALRPAGRGLKPEVAGRSTGRIKRDALHSLEYDGDARPPSWYCVAEYSFRSEPIPNPA